MRARGHAAARTWTVRDGAPAEILAMAQTPDGMLWLGTPDGLYRFDGIAFTRAPLPPGAAAMKRISSLTARPNGELWITDDVEHIFVLRGDTVRDMTAYDLPTMQARSLAFDPDGSVWAAGVLGLLHYSGGKWRLLGPAEGLEHAMILSVLADQHGQVWVADNRGLHLLDRAVGRFRQVLAGADARLAQAPDGQVWLLKPDEAVPAPMPPQVAPRPRAPDFNYADSRARGLFDRDGNLWVLQCPTGLCLLPAGTPTRYGPKHPVQRFEVPLSSSAVNCALEDREGNLWFGTQSGLDRLRPNKVIRTPIPNEHGVYTMAGDTEGNVWIADPVGRVAWKVGPDGIPVADRSEPFTQVANDRDGALLLGGRRDIVRRYRGVETRIPLPPLPDGRAADLTLFGLRDDGETLWIGAVEFGVAGRVDGKWHYRSHWDLPPKIYTSANVGKGQMWLALADGDLMYWDRGRRTSYDARAVGLVAGIFAGPELVVGGDKGLAVLQGGRLRLLHAADADVLRNVSGMTVAPNGDRWLNGQRGIVHVQAADWHAALADPARPLRYLLIDSHDGYPGRAMLDNRLPSLFTAPDGQLWFMASGGIVRLDPANVRRNGVAPQVRVEGVGTDGATYPAAAPVRLPPGTRRFSVDYGAPSLVRADGVRFQYQLVGIDTAWQDGGARRAAWYTNVGPGSYLFRVRAVNEDGTPGDAEARMAIEVAPTVTQTAWFRALLGVAAAALLYLLYRYRLHVATGRVAERLNVRLAERERIARTLHDTFLQSVQALVLRVHAAAAELPDDSAVRRKLEAVLEQADRTLTEGRDQVHELRSGRDLAAALTETGHGLAAAFPDTAFALRVTGTGMPLQADVQEELIEAGGEALRNAFRHARARRVDVTLAYGRDAFALRVEDNGRGIADAPEQPARRHFGIVGMRERAARIGAAFALDSTPGMGTTVELRVPARLAYPEPARRGGVTQ